MSHSQAGTGISGRGAATALGLALWLVAAGVAAGRSGQESGTPPTVATVPGEGPFLSPDEAMELEGQELTDEKTGFKYVVEKVPKVARAYRWIDATRCRFPLGVTLEVVAHDDDWFWVKSYEEIDKPNLDPQTVAAEAAAAKARAEARRRETEASYPSSLPSADRLRFERFDAGLPQRGQWRNGFDVADVDGDGQLDIVFGPARKGRQRPNVFLGDGQGHWRQWSEATYPRLPYDYGDARVADFDGDGRADIALTMHLRGMAVLVQREPGHFHDWSRGISLYDPTEPGAGRGFASRAIEVRDWNDDGRPDLVALGEGPQALQRRRGAPRDGVHGKERREPDALRGVVDISRGILVYLNQGDGEWEAQRLEPATEESMDFGDDFALGDLDGDGRLDVVIATSRMGNDMVLHRGTADGGLATASLPGLRPRALLGAVAVGELTGDGVSDLLVGYRNSELGVWRTGIDLLPSRGERRGLVAEESAAGILALDVGDLDGDGAQDFVALTGDGEVWVFLGDGAGGFSREDSPELTKPLPGCVGFGVRIADLDADGRAEVIASFAGEPTGLPGTELSEPGCPGQGSLRVWKAAPSPGPAPATPSRCPLGGAPSRPGAPRGRPPPAPSPVARHTTGRAADRPAGGPSPSPLRLSGGASLDSAPARVLVSVPLLQARSSVPHDRWRSVVRQRMVAATRQRAVPPSIRWCGGSKSENYGPAGPFWPWQNQTS